MTFAISKPVTNGTFTYAYRDTAGVWSAEIPMTRGVNEPTKNFIAPACDELRITGTLAASESVDRCQIEGLSVTSGLGFDFTVGATNQAYAQTVYTRPKSSHRQTLRISETTDTSIVLIITGIAQNLLNIRQIVFAKTAWQPDHYFNRGASQNDFNSYEASQTGSSNYSHLKSKLHGEDFPFKRLSSDNWLDLEHLLDETLLNGFCLIEKDIESDEYIDSYMARVTVNNVTNDYLNLNSLTINAAEAFSQ